MDNDRRLVFVAVSFELLSEMVYKGYKVENGIECVEGLPDGAVCVGSFFDWQSMTGYITFQHKSFPIIPLGSIIPIVRVSHRKL